VNCHHCRARPIHGRDEIRAVQHIRPGQQHFERERPRLEAMVRRRKNRPTRDIGSDSQRPQVFAVLKADELVIIARHIGERGQQLSRILWYAALPVGVQASIDRNTHIVFIGVLYHNVVICEYVHFI
jgi:hypothetical protein